MFSARCRLYQHDAGALSPSALIYSAPCSRSTPGEQGASRGAIGSLPAASRPSLLSRPPSFSVSVAASILQRNGVVLLKNALQPEVVDEAADADADSIPGSNSTYEFAGVRADQPQTLYTRTYSCACRRCRPPSAVGTEYAACPYLSTVRPRCD